MVLKSSPLWRRCHAVTDEGNFVLYKVEIKRFKLNFSLIKKIPAPSKISLRPHIPCAYGNRFCNVYGNRYRIYVLKSMPERFYSAKFLKSQISITQLIILSRKTQCNCVLIKVLIELFQKFIGFGATPQGL